ncbi:MAG: metallophosphoesterase, partial [Desulfovibrionaceae bacterium]|nr:metallophosphoesterase [Desulfovibrionaceae bacterium]
MLSILLSLALVLSLACAGLTASAAEVFPASSYSGKLVILHTNDTHGRDLGGTASVGTAGVAQLKKDFEARGAKVLLVSAGDAIQGTPLVNMDQGASAVKFMEAAKYDLLVPGNHEFDFGAENLLDILDEFATFDVLSANIIDEEEDDLLFAANKIFTISGVKVGVFGLTTPETYTKTHPDKIAGLSFLMDEDLYDEAQAQVDFLKGEGCDFIICVGHLGIDVASEPNCSTDVIANTSGIDLFIDGHSHSLIDPNEDKEKEGKGRLVEQDGGDETLLVSAKQYLEYVGVVVYDLSAKKIDDAYLVAPADYDKADPTVKALVEARNAEVEEELKT